MSKLQVLFFTICLMRPCEASATPEHALTLPSFKLIRYEEDYRFLKNQQPLDGLANKIKYLQFSPESDAYLSLGGELRERY